MDQVIDTEASQLTTRERIDAARQAVRDHKQTIQDLVEAHLDDPSGDRSSLDAAEARLATLEATVRALENRKAIEDAELDRYQAELDAMWARERREAAAQKYAEASAKVGRGAIDALVASTVETVTGAIRQLQAADRELRAAVKQHNERVGTANHYARDLGFGNMYAADFGEIQRRVKSEVEQSLRKGAASSFEFKIPRELFPNW